MRTQVIKSAMSKVDFQGRKFRVATYSNEHFLPVRWLAQALEMAPSMYRGPYFQGHPEADAQYIPVQSSTGPRMLHCIPLRNLQSFLQGICGGHLKEAQFRFLTDCKENLQSVIESAISQPRVSKKEPAMIKQTQRPLPIPPKWEELGVIETVPPRIPQPVQKLESVPSRPQVAAPLASPIENPQAHIRICHGLPCVSHQWFHATFLDRNGSGHYSPWWSHLVAKGLVKEGADFFVESVFGSKGRRKTMCYLTLTTARKLARFRVSKVGPREAARLLADPPSVTQAIAEPEQCQPLDCPFKETATVVNGFLGYDARKLHELLGVGRAFAHWIPDRIEKCRFIEGTDYVKYESFDLPVLANQTSNGRGGDRRSIEYHISSDMLKHLCMVEKNEIGHRIRMYFIEMEKLARKQATENAPPLPPPPLSTKQASLSAIANALAEIAKALAASAE